MIYLDSSATTKPCEQAIAAAVNALETDWGNPGSLHAMGTHARDIIDNARKSVARELSCDEDEVYFTGSGTTANNTAIFGAASSRGKRRKTVVTTSIEHPSVLNAMSRLERDGFDVRYLKSDRFGRFSLDELDSLLTNDVCLVSIMAVNNELGTVNDIGAAGKLIKKKCPEAVFHVDGVQAFGKIDLKVHRLGIDLLSMSAHKIHGPKGVGALYVRDGLFIEPYVVGGGQENGMYSGTEAVPAIAGFGAAVDCLPKKSETLKKVGELKSRLVEKLSDDKRIFVNSPDDALPYILNISCMGVPSQPMVNALSEQGICVSAGSACKRGHRSDVLVAAGLESDRIDSAFRISLSRFNTLDEMDITAQKIKEIIDRIGK